MKLSDFNKKADEYTAKASEITRQLILGGLAIIWLFKTTISGREVLDHFLIYPLITLSVALISDLLQYVIAGRIWKSFFLNKEKEMKHEQNSDPELKAPKSLSRPIYFFYWLKIWSMLLSYLLLIIFLLEKVNLE